MNSFDRRHRRSRRHHYVPQWIIREFAAGKNAAKRVVNAYDCKSGHVRRVSPSDVFVKKNLNTISTDTGPDDRFESWDAEWERQSSAEAKRIAQAAVAGYLGADHLKWSGENPPWCTIGMLMAQAKRIMAHDRKGTLAPLWARSFRERRVQYSQAEEKILRVVLSPGTIRKMEHILGCLKPAICVTHPNDEFVLVDEPLISGDVGAFVVVSPRVMIGRLWHGVLDPRNRTERVIQVLRATTAEVLDINLAMSRECRTIVSRSPTLGEHLAQQLALEPEHDRQQPEPALFWKLLEPRVTRAEDH